MKHVASIHVAQMVVAVMVVRLDNAAVAVAVMDVVLIQIIVAHRANFLKKTTPLSLILPSSLACPHQSFS